MTLMPQIKKLGCLTLLIFISFKAIKMVKIAAAAA